MFRHGYCTSAAFLGVAACVTLACGSSAHQIMSISVSPSSADARDYPGGKVPYVATGNYKTSPVTVTPQQANWGVASEQVVNGVENFGPANGAVSVDASGVAQCAAGASGAYAVAAWTVTDPKLMATCASEDVFGAPGCNAVEGTALLTCP